MSPRLVTLPEDRQSFTFESKAILWNGEIIELDSNEVIFSDQPKDKRTYDYVNGIFG